MTDKPNTQKPKQCPFCDEPMEVVYHDDADGYWYPKCSDSFCVAHSLEAQGSQEAAINAINHRPTEDALRNQAGTLLLFSLLFLSKKPKRSIAEKYAEKVERAKELRKTKGDPLDIIKKISFGEPDEIEIERLYARIKELEAAIDSADDTLALLEGMGIKRRNNSTLEEIEMDEFIKEWAKSFRAELTQARRPE